MIDYVKCLHKPIYTDELETQIVKNLVFLINQITTTCKTDTTNIAGVYKQISIVARRAMIDIKSSKDRLKAIL
jgi:hypothetical protein